MVGRVKTFGRALRILQFFAVFAVLALDVRSAAAAVFAPMCDPEGATLPVAAPPSDGDSGAIDSWACPNGDLAAASVLAAAPVGGEGNDAVPLAPSSWVLPAGAVVLPRVPVLKTSGIDLGAHALPAGYSAALYRPPR